MCEFQRCGTPIVIEVEAVKTGEQRQQVEAHLAAQGAVDAYIWKVDVNTALRISDLLSLTMDDVRTLDTENPALNINEQKSGKPRKIVVNQTAMAVIQQRIAGKPVEGRVVVSNNCRVV